jgi:hypothetical protein
MFARNQIFFGQNMRPGCRCCVWENNPTEFHTLFRLFTEEVDCIADRGRKMGSHHFAFTASAGTAKRNQASQRSCDESMVAREIADLVE